MNKRIASELTRIARGLYYDRVQDIKNIRDDHKDAYIKESEDGQVVGVCYSPSAGLWKYMIWVGRANKPKFVDYFSEYGLGSDAKKKCTDAFEKLYFRALRAWEERVELNRRKREERQNFKHSIQLGDIFYTSWGYDQTNVDFYKVVGVLAKSVEVVGIGSKIVDSDRGVDYVVPDVRSVGRKKFRCLVRVGNTFRVDGQHARKWDGDKLYQTASGYGH